MRYAGLGSVLAVAAGLGFSGSRLVVQAAEPVCTSSGPTVNCTLGGFEIDGNTVSNGGTDWQSAAVYTSGAYTPFYDLFNSTSDDMMGQGSKESDQTTWSCVNSKPPGKSDLGGPSYTATSPSSDSGGDPGTAAGEFAPKNGKSWAGAIWFENTNPGGSGNQQFLFSNFQRFAVNGDVHLDIEFNKASTLLSSGCPTLPVRSQGDLLLTYDTVNGGAQIFVSAFVFNCTTVVSKGTPCPGMLGAFAADTANLVNGDTFAGTANIPPAGSDSGVTAGAYGEAGLNLTRTIGNFTCGEFGQTYMRTRSAGTSDIANGKAEVKDYVQPVPFNPGLCPTSTLAKFQADETTQGADAAATNESGATDQTADAALTYTNECSATNNTGSVANGPAACASGASTTELGANPGDELSYQLVYKNTGGGNAPNPVVTDTIPAGTSYVGGSQTCPSGFLDCIAAATVATDPCTSTAASSASAVTTLIWCLPSEAPTGTGSGVSMYFEVDLPATRTSAGALLVENFGHVTDTQVTSDTASNSNFVAAKAVYAPSSGLAKVQADVQAVTQKCNTATIGSAPVSSNNDCIYVLGSAVTPSYTGNDINAAPGDVLQYKLTYTNNGTASASNVVVEDGIPSGSSYVGSSQSCPSGATCIAATTVATNPCTSSPASSAATVATLIWCLGTQGVGASVDLTFQVKVNATGWANGTTNDGVSNFGSVEAPNATTSNTVNADIVAAANLGLVKTAAVLGNGDIRYVISYFNTGNGDLTGQTITDDLSAAGLKFVSISSTPSVSCTTPTAGTTGTVSCTVDVAGGTQPGAPAGTITIEVSQ